MATFKQRSRRSSEQIQRHSSRIETLDPNVCSLCDQITIAITRGPRQMLQKLQNNEVQCQHAASCCSSSCKCYHALPQPAICKSGQNSQPAASSSCLLHGCHELRQVSLGTLPPADLILQANAGADMAGNGRQQQQACQSNVMDAASRQDSSQQQPTGGLQVTL